MDRQSGIDPFSLVIAYNGVLVGAAAYDPASGLALFPLPVQAPVIKPGKTKAVMEASDNQEAKNIASIGNNPMPNTTFRSFVIRAVPGPAVSWLVPPAGVCVKRVVRLGVSATSTARVSSVRFYDGEKLIKKVTKGAWEPVRRRLAHHQGEDRPAHAPGDSTGPPGPQLQRVSQPSRLPVDRRVALITGGSSGIGAAIARRFAADGWQCVLLARGEERLRAVAEEIGAEYELCDVADRAQVDAVAERVLARHPQIRLVVCSAGIPGRHGFLRADPEVIQQVIETNYLGASGPCGPSCRDWRPQRPPMW